MTDTGVRLNWVVDTVKGSILENWQGVGAQAEFANNITIYLHRRPSSDPYFFNCTYVYVKCDSAFTNHWQQIFFRCMGGKTHVIC